MNHCVGDSEVAIMNFRRFERRVDRPVLFLTVGGRVIVAHVRPAHSGSVIADHLVRELGFLTGNGRGRVIFPDGREEWTDRTAYVPVQFEGKMVCLKPRIFNFQNVELILGRRDLNALSTIINLNDLYTPAPEDHLEDRAITACVPTLRPPTPVSPIAPPTEREGDGRPPGVQRLEVAHGPRRSSRVRRCKEICNCPGCV